MAATVKAPIGVASFPDFLAYQVDAWQRSILFLDVMRRREEQSREQAALDAPHVLEYESELICDGRTLPRPVNYGLVRILPAKATEPDPRKRPFVVVDPRAGHGPGIGGFKADSEIGVALKAGHPCYFIGFLPQPMPGQTIGDIAVAEAAFLEAVIALHPQAEGKPCVIGNCQAGWAIAILAAMRPELFGPIILAGSPLSYWAGVRGQNPMRYSGGLLGGSWLTAMTADLGAGVFDGAWLVYNFEAQNPANTYWTKQYNLYSKIDTEAERYLGFEKWWTGHIDLNAEEIQFIVDELFIGNKLAAGEIRAPGGAAVDMRNIRSPIVVFCSQGDNITPPQQALGWILDLYDSVDEIRAHGQTIVYTIHDTIGHLGIFVSGGVAKKEHDEFASNIDLIDLLPPGLYEAVLTPKAEADDNPDLITGDWLMRCEARDLDDIRALGGNNLAEERSFAAAARVSEINLALYRTFAAPAVRAMVTPPMADALRRLHPLRLQADFFAPSNPFMAWVKATAAAVEGARQPADSDNPFLAMQKSVSDGIVAMLENVRKSTERASEEIFRKVYGSTALQAAVGIDTNSTRPIRKAPKSGLHDALVERRIGELRAAMTQGGLREAAIRALLYVGMERGAADERGFEAIRRLREASTDDDPPTLDAFKALVREQFFMLLIDEDAALAAIGALLPEAADSRRRAVGAIRSILGVQGALSQAAADRLQRIEALFGQPLAIADGRARATPLGASPALEATLKSSAKARQTRRRASVAK
jgi:hypothetical protein